MGKSMKLVIAGGCGEHGRNCFWVKKGKLIWIVDCGLAETASDCYPRLSRKMIQSAKYLFLTHSHADHAGAIPWLLSMGFSGNVVATESTFEQICFTVPNKLVLEEVCPEGKGVLGGIRIRWGRSGHCVGSVWYRFRAGSKRILFSGDYTEHTKVYQTDRIRGRKADFAVLDCAYGMRKQRYGASCRSLIEELTRLRETISIFFLPVPNYGRGSELLQLLWEKFPDSKFYGDVHFIRQLENLNNNAEWCQEGRPEFTDVQLYSDRVEQGFVFLSDPQLRSTETKELARKILEKGGYGVLTGTVEKDSYSSELLQKEKASLLYYPVHLNYSQYLDLAEKNSFKRVLPYHTQDFQCESEYNF